MARGAPTAAVFAVGQFCRGLSGTSATGSNTSAGVCAVYFDRIDHSIFDWKPPPYRQWRGGIRAVPIGLGAGLVSGLAGIAGGNVIVPTLIYFNVPAHRATATASTLGVPIAATGALGYMLLPPASDQPGMLGYVDLQAFIFIVAGAVVAAPLGVRYAQRLPAATLKRVFAVMLLLVALRMMF